MDNCNKANATPAPVRLVASTSPAVEYHYQPVAVSSHAMSTKVYEIAASEVDATKATTKK